MTVYDQSDTASNLSNHIRTLRSEIVRLRQNLLNAQKETQQFAADEKNIREENTRLQRKLQMEVERREALCRHLSESESSLEMEEERLYNESLLNNSVTSLNSSSRQRTISSPVPHSPSNSRPISPGSASSGSAFSAAGRCCTCGQMRRSSGFIKPAIPLLGPNASGNPSFGGGGGGVGLSGSMPSNRNSLENNCLMSSSGAAIAGGFSPNHSQSAATSNSIGGVSGNGGAAAMHTFLQPASPMDTSVYKD